MAARVLTLADALVAVVTAAWVSYNGGPTGGDAVSRDWPDEIGVDADQANVVQGRQVLLFAEAYSAPELADRADLLKQYRVAWLVVERYTDPGTPTKAWVDARVDFVEAVLFDVLRDPYLTVASTFTPDPDVPAEVGEAVAIDVLRKDKLFFSYGAVTFCELEGV